MAQSQEYKKYRAGVLRYNRQSKNIAGILLSPPLSEEDYTRVYVTPKAKKVTA